MKFYENGRVLNSDYPDLRIPFVSFSKCQLVSFFPCRRLICQACGSIPLTKILDSTTFQLQELAPEETLKYFVLQACVHAILP